MCTDAGRMVDVMVWEWEDSLLIASLFRMIEIASKLISLDTSGKEVLEDWGQRIKFEMV